MRIRQLAPIERPHDLSWPARSARKQHGMRPRREPRNSQVGHAMNQPAAKEPTMDEILSSIRQIIADDDEAANRRAPEPARPTPSPVAAVPDPASIPSEAPRYEEMINPF